MEGLATGSDFRSPSPGAPALDVEPSISAAGFTAQTDSGNIPGRPSRSLRRAVRAREGEDLFWVEEKAGWGQHISTTVSQVYMVKSLPLSIATSERSLRLKLPNNVLKGGALS